MKDREAHDYRVAAFHVDLKKGWRHQWTLRLSVARQNKKARALSGRQEKRWRQMQRQTGRCTPPRLAVAAPTTHEEAGT